MKSTNCSIKGCNADGTCFNNPVICANVACYDNKGCVEALGGCQKTSRNCDDKNACTLDKCDVAKNNCTNVATPCAATDKCTVATCNTTLGCVTAPVNCDDKIECTIDTCNPLTGCVHTPADTYCEDNNLCTNQSCVVGKGCVYVNLTCTVNSPCLDPVCQPTYGCRNLETLCILNDKDEAVKAYNADLDTKSTPEQKASQVQKADQAAAANDERRKKKQDCSYAVCQNSTCVKKELACAGDNTVVAVVSGVLAAGAIAGIVIAAVVLCLGAGGGAYYLSQGAGIGTVGAVNTSPLFVPPGNSADNPLADPTI